MGKEFLNDLVVDCQINVKAYFLGIPIAYTQNEKINQLQDKIKLTKVDQDENQV
jgi:hypothetical protein